AIIAGQRLSANFRPAPYISVDWNALAFCCIAQPPIASARIASPIQLSNQSSLDGRRLEMSAVKSALIPIRMPPQPGTAVKEPARSIVSRMYLRFSTARSLMDTTVAFFIFMTIGVRAPIVKYFTIQRQVPKSLLRAGARLGYSQRS